MRRLAAAVAVHAFVLVPAAGAHPAFQPGFAPQGSTSVLLLIIPNERKSPMTALELVAPTSVELVAADSSGGWHGAVSGPRASWAGRTLRPQEIAQVGLRVRPTGEPGTARFRVTQRFADRRAVHWPLELTVTPGAADDGGGFRYGVLGVVGAGAAATLVFVLWLRRRPRRLQEE